MITKPYIVVGPHTHFTYNDKTNEVSCTHGGWSGYIKFNEDGTCKIEVSKNHIINYKSYIFTDATSSEEAYELGLIAR